MRLYEVVYILDPALDEGAVTAKLEKFHALATADGGEVSAVDHWGTRQLAYPIKRQSTGYYVVSQFTASVSALPEFERLLKLDDEVLRYLLVINEGEPTSGQSIVAEVRSTPSEAGEDERRFPSRVPGWPRTPAPDGGAPHRAPQLQGRRDAFPIPHRIREDPPQAHHQGHGGLPTAARLGREARPVPGSRALYPSSRRIGIRWRVRALLEGTVHSEAGGDGRAPRPSSGWPWPPPSSSRWR